MKGGNEDKEWKRILVMNGSVKSGNLIRKDFKWNWNAARSRQKTILDGGNTAHTFLMGLRLKEEFRKPYSQVGGWVVFFQGIFPLCSSILQVGTCQIFSLAENPRWSRVWQKSHNLSFTISHYCNNMSLSERICLNMSPSLIICHYNVTLSHSDY